MTAANAYEGVEAPANFPSTKALEQYRDAAIEKSRAQADFIATNFPDSRRLFEACCGNGRLLVALAERMEHMAGIDIAASRVAFAQRWVEDRRLDYIDVWLDDVLNPQRDVADYRADLVVCITGAFGYFEPAQAGGDRRAAENFSRVAKLGQNLLLELYQYPQWITRCLERSDRTFREWIELPESDPFRFYLSEYRFDPERIILRHAKIFVGRDGRIDDGRVEFLRIYGPDEIEAVLRPWFCDVTFYRDWSGAPYREGDDTMIVTARRCNEGRNGEDGAR